MSDYISREAAITALCHVCSRSGVCLPGDSCVAYEKIKSLPAADVRPVVCCRDCVHYEFGVCLKIYDDGNASKDAWQERKPMDFCSFGKDRNVPINRGAEMRSTNCTKTATADEEREVLNVRAWLNNGAEMKEDV